MFMSYTDNKDTDKHAHVHSKSRRFASSHISEDMINYLILCCFIKLQYYLMIKCRMLSSVPFLMHILNKTESGILISCVISLLAKDLIFQTFSFSLQLLLSVCVTTLKRLSLLHFSADIFYSY